MDKDIQAMVSAAGYAGILAQEAITLKRQQTRNLHDTYMQKRNQVVTELGIPTLRKEIRVGFDLFKITNPHFDLSLLQSKFQDFNASLPTINIYTACRNTTKTMDMLIDERNAWIESFKKAGLGHKEALQLYFGLENPNGRDTTYKSLIENLRSINDDLIAFSLLLHENLLLQSLKLREKRRKLGKIEELRYSHIDLSEPQSEGLIPGRKLYGDFEIDDSFPKAPWWRTRKRQSRDAREKIQKIWV